MVRARLGYSAKASAEDFGGIKRVTPQFVEAGRRRLGKSLPKSAEGFRAHAAQGKKCKKRCDGGTLN